MELHITSIPSDPHFRDFCSDPKVAGIRMNGLLFKGTDLDRELSLIPGNVSVPLWFDAKGRQLRVEESISHRDHLELVLNHGIDIPTPHPIIFKAGEDWAFVETITDDGKRLHLRADGYPKYRVKPGDSIHFRNPALTVKGNLFTDDEVARLQKVRSLGFKRFYLSYVESESDVRQFREIVGEDADVILKIENLRGLGFAKTFTPEKFLRTRLACARGDLYVEVDRPHHIVNAQGMIAKADANAIVGSRILLSLFHSEVPSASDVCELALLQAQGYRNFLLCDDLCKKGSALRRAVDTFDGIFHP